MSEYGWISTTTMFSQYDGFFVDSENRILYWRDKTGLGVVLDEDQFGELARALEDIQEQVVNNCVKRLISLWLIILFGIPLAIFFIFLEIIPSSHLYAYEIGILSVMALLVLWAGWPSFVYIQRLGLGKLDRYQPARIGNILENARFIDMRRPEAPRLHPSVQDSNWKNFLAYGGGLAIAAWLILGSVPITQGEYRSIAFFAMGVILGLITIYRMADEFRGKKTKDIRLYEFKNITNAPKEPEKKFFKMDLKSPGESGIRPMCIMMNVSVLTLILQTIVFTMIVF